MKNLTKYALAAIATATSAMQVPAIQNAVSTYLNNHRGAASIIGGLITLIALVHNPVKES